MANLFGLYFNFWILAAFLCGGTALAYLWKKNRLYQEKTLSFSNTEDLTGNIGYNFSKLPFWLFTLSFIFFSLALIDPHTFIEREGAEHQPPPTPVEGVAIYLVLDKSGSMSEEVATPGESGRHNVQSKLSLMKEVTSKFVEARPSDLIGLISFARQADVLAPLTLDHASVVQALNEIQQVPQREMDGTAIGYAIYKSASLIDATKSYTREKKEANRPAYEIKNNIIILVTDGLQDPNVLDQGNRLRTMGLDEAAEYAKQKGVKLYIINVDPQFATDRYAPQRRQLARITKLTGGRFYMLDSAKELQKVYNDINNLEKSLLPNLSKELLPEIYTAHNFYPWLLAWGLAFFLAAVISKTLIFRRVP